MITTSNLIQAMDPAFLDRTGDLHPLQEGYSSLTTPLDVKMFVDVPKCPAAYTIFRNSFNELIRAGIVLSEVAGPRNTNE